MVNERQTIQATPKYRTGRLSSTYQTQLVKLARHANTVRWQILQYMLGQRAELKRPRPDTVDIVVLLVRNWKKAARSNTGTIAGTCVVLSGTDVCNWLRISGVNVQVFRMPSYAKYGCSIFSNRHFKNWSFCWKAEAQLLRINSRRWEDAFYFTARITFGSSPNRVVHAVLDSNFQE